VKEIGGFRGGGARFGKKIQEAGGRKELDEQKREEGKEGAGSQTKRFRENCGVGGAGGIDEGDGREGNQDWESRTCLFSRV